MGYRTNEPTSPPRAAQTGTPQSPGFGSSGALTSGKLGGDMGSVARLRMPPDSVRHQRATVPPVPLYYTRVYM